LDRKYFIVWPQYYCEVPFLFTTDDDIGYSGDMLRVLQKYSCPKGFFENTFTERIISAGDVTIQLFGNTFTERII